MATPYKTEVTDAASTRDLARLDVVKRDLGISGGADDAYLGDQISAASAAIETWCNRRLAQEELSDSFRLPVGGRAVEVLSLAVYPVAAIASVTEDGTALVAADYELDSATGFLWRLDGSDNRRCWPSGAKIEVAYTGGYELLATLPREIEQACLSMVRRNWFARRRDPLVKAEEVPDVLRQEFWVGQVGDGGALTPEAVSLLAPFRRMMI